jgi:threonyl-tRNA synthetase
MVNSFQQKVNHKEVKDKKFSFTLEEDEDGNMRGILKCENCVHILAQTIEQIVINSPELGAAIVAGVKIAISTDVEDNSNKEK